MHRAQQQAGQHSSFSISCSASRLAAAPSRRRLQLHSKPAGHSGPSSAAVDRMAGYHDGLGSSRQSVSPIMYGGTGTSRPHIHAFRQTRPVDSPASQVASVSAAAVVGQHRIQRPGAESWLSFGPHWCLGHPDTFSRCHPRGALLGGQGEGLYVYQSLPIASITATLTDRANNRGSSCPQHIL